MLFFGREEKVLQELAGREFVAIAHVHILCNVSHGINHLLVILETHSLL